MTGHNYRRTRFKKRTHRNQDLGPFVNHEMNRCIQCYRCVRFYRDYAGGRDLDVFASHDSVYFGRARGRRARKRVQRQPGRGLPHRRLHGQDAQAPLHAQVGPPDRALGLRPLRPRLQHHPRRAVRHAAQDPEPLQRRGERLLPLRPRPVRLRVREQRQKDQEAACQSLPFSSSGSGLGEGEHRLQPADKDAALKHIAGILSSSKKTIGIGSPRASLESNFALRELVGPDNFYSGMSAQESTSSSRSSSISSGKARPARRRSTTSNWPMRCWYSARILRIPLPCSTWQCVSPCKNKPKEIAEKMRIPAWDDNAVRNAVQDETGPLYIAWLTGTKLDDIATKTCHAAPDDIARLGFAIAHELNPQAPALPFSPPRRGPR